MYFRRRIAVGVFLLLCCAMGGGGLDCVRDVKPPYQPGHDEVSRFHERRCDDGSGSGEEPEEKEAGSRAVAGVGICLGRS